MELRRVFYESWQMECCGTPFSVGEEVSWPLAPVLPMEDMDDVEDVEDVEDVDDVDDVESGKDASGEGPGEEVYGAALRVEFHGGKWPETRGRVRAIRLVHQEYMQDGPGSRSFAAVSGKWSLEAVDSCPKWFEQEKQLPRQGGRGRMRRADGVVVTLEVPDAAPPESRDRP